MKCPHCHEGYVTLFSSREKCGDCGGTGEIPDESQDSGLTGKVTGTVTIGGCGVVDGNTVISDGRYTQWLDDPADGSRWYSTPGSNTNRPKALAKLDAMVKVRCPGLWDEYVEKVWVADGKVQSFGDFARKLVRAMPADYAAKNWWLNGEWFHSVIIHGVEIHY